MRQRGPDEAPSASGSHRSGILLEPIVARLASLIEQYGWRRRFDEAIAELRAKQVPSLEHIRELADYFAFLDDMVTWAPREREDTLLVHDKLVEFHFLLDLPPVRSLQDPIDPSSGIPTPSPLSAWIVDFARSWGAYLDTTASAAHVESFQANAAFRWHDYMAPPSGYLTFNQFFARHVKPGRRPIEALCDPHVLVAAADAAYMGMWAIDDDSTIVVEDSRLSLKKMRWSLAQMLHGSAFAHRFAGGILTHSGLRTYDYHRWHAPLDGTVVEARVMTAQVWMDVEVVDKEVGGKPTRVIEAVEGTGYQFLQTRGLVVLATTFGLVACLPVGMSHVSSVVITAELGAHLHKGEEMGYFQFGGSDFVMVFEASCNAKLEGRIGETILQGRRLGRVG